MYKVNCYNYVIHAISEFGERLLESFIKVSECTHALM